jgi:hypothetical protein
MYSLQINQLVMSEPKYEVLTQGQFELLDLIPCGRVVDNGQITCAFLTATCVGINLEDVNSDKYNN